MAAEMADRQPIDDMQQFVRTVIEAAKTIMKINYHINCKIKYRQVIKNNDQRWDGITFEKPGTKIHPTVYVNQAYARYQDHPEDLDRIVREITDQGYQYMEHAIQMPDLTLEEAKKCVRLDIRELQSNQKYLEGVPFYTIGEGEGALAAYPIWEMDSNSFFKVSEDVCSQLGLVPEEILKIADTNIQNMDYRLEPIGSVLKKIMGDMGSFSEDLDQMMEYDQTPQMLVLTTPDNSRGAALMMSDRAMREAKDILQCEQVFVIPSSIHECLIVPGDNNEITPDILKNMICEVNQTMPIEDVLTSVPLKYDTKLSLAIEPPEMKLAHETVRTIKQTMDKTMENSLDNKRERKMSMTMA